MKHTSRKFAVAALLAGAALSAPAQPSVPVDVVQPADGALRVASVSALADDAGVVVTGRVSRSQLTRLAGARNVEVTILDASGQVTGREQARVAVPARRSEQSAHFQVHVAGTLPDGARVQVAVAPHAR